MTTYQTLDLKRENDVLEVILNHKNGANTVSITMLKELIQLADWLRDEKGINYVIFTNTGRFFSVGADLVELVNDFTQAEAQSENIRRMQIVGQEMMRKLESLEQITFAAIQGSAYGAGVAIAMTTDFRFMTESSVFNLPETNVGLFLTWGCTPRLVKSVGAVKAKELIMLCEDVSAEECLQLGLINKVVRKEEMKDVVYQTIEKLRRKGPLSIRLTKKLVNASVAPNFGDILINETELVERVAISGEPAAKMNEFLKSKGK
ncbi:enoyl-CoA hydratase/isomerase family protein [Bacillus sp. EB106-08-02-XG196]|uniref:enoyl-CoA hydratase/isomerase family protein n=1 Tax=Bacillus sp. EB106-08-02-XG196 TaxID=2737049 RepID=UPI0015C41591|nr:enoyl-CoA hydratase/isomerase family protein [Bacillus sp. EB106-08-02-XG196]NWQ41871.1 enoyl-CoA hydratase/isomerase family protein [Bacillus sp. EB106-08-02-XG196]